MKKQKTREYDAIITIYGLGGMLKKKRYEVAYWLRNLAREVENNHEAYTNGRFSARYCRPKNERIKK